MSLVFFVLCSYGITQILVYSKIFEKIRPNHYFFKCPMCMGFWVGVFLFSINGWTELFTYKYLPLNALLLGGLSSGTSYVLCRLFGDQGFNINHIIQEQRLEEFDTGCRDCGGEFPFYYGEGEEDEQHVE